MRKLPQRFVDRVTHDLGESEASRLLAALESDPPTSIRFNPYKLAERPEGLEPIAWSRYGFYLEERPSFTYDTAFHAGTYYVQEASSQFVGHILSSASEGLEGLRILDTCAAPGGKTTLYSTLVGLEGLVVAGEINRQRATVLADNVRKWGLANVVVVNGDATQLSQFEAFYDVVAVDAPCSGEGMFRKAEVAREEWSEGSVAVCAERQSEILRAAWRALKPGGILLYSTCTFNSVENEQSIAQFEEEREGEVVGFERVEIDEEWGIERGEVGAFQTFRFMPHRTKGEGFFAAVARKSYDTAGRMWQPKSRKNIFTPLARIDLAECARWVEQPERMSFYSVGDTIYGYFNAQLDVVKRLAESLTVIYSGVAMGQIFKGKLSPDGALALFVGYSRDAVNVAELEYDEAIEYLRRCEVKASNFEEGINLVCDDAGNALGFVKRIGQRVNNRYISSLRILK